MRSTVKNRFVGLRIDGESVAEFVARSSRI